jgi:hypothetical protein
MKKSGCTLKIAWTGPWDNISLWMSSSDSTFNGYAGDAKSIDPWYSGVSGSSGHWIVSWFVFLISHSFALCLWPLEYFWQYSSTILIEIKS